MTKNTELSDKAQRLIREKRQECIEEIEALNVEVQSAQDRYRGAVEALVDLEDLDLPETAELVIKDDRVYFKEATPENTDIEESDGE